MAVDLDAIRKRVLELSGQRRTSNVQLWKPEAGNYVVRGIPWKTTVDGMPFIERKFYYLGDNPRILAPSQFQKPDPINDLLRKLYSSGKPDDRAMAKGLQPKMTAYMAVIVRGQEDKGPQVWGFNKFIYQRLLSFFTEEDVGDFLDPLTGFDLKVAITPSQKRYNGRVVNDTVIDAARRSSKLSDNPEQAKKWLDGVPVIDDMYPQKTPAEIEVVLNAWLANGVVDETAADEGTTRGAEKPKDELDQLAADVKQEAKAASAASKADAVEPAKTLEKSKGKKKTVDIDDDTPPAKSQSLDDAFEELMEDDKE